MKGNSAVSIEFMPFITWAVLVAQWCNCPSDVQTDLRSIPISESVVFWVVFFKVVSDAISELTKCVECLIKLKTI